MAFALEMDWRHLLFENWPVDPAVLTPHLPDALDLDTHDGRAWLSVVPFENAAIRPRGLPQWAGLSLPEINVRTYVTYERRPAVYFFSLDAQGIAGVLGARLFHHLPYYYARISLSAERDRIRFASRRRHPGARPAVYEATYRPIGEPFSTPRSRWRSSSSNATASTPRPPTATSGIRRSSTTPGGCTPPRRRSPRTAYWAPSASSDPMPILSTTTARAWR